MVKALFPYKHERLQDIRKRAFGDDENKIYIYKDSHVQEPVCCGIVKRYIILPDKEYDDKMLYYVLRPCIPGDAACNTTPLPVAAQIPLSYGTDTAPFQGRLWE